MDNTTNAAQASTSAYPPVVSVLGHVDHGKTTLLDAIRSSNIASREAGGITQNIGASQITVEHEGKNRLVTFIDTPGHEAFANMRSQGVSAADIVLLIVAADDGVKPQTKESIEKIKEAKLPFIVVFTKMDAPGAHIEKAKQDVAKEGILLEGFGGETPFVAVSAKTGQGVKELLDLILLVHDLNQPVKDALGGFMGVVIDAKLDKRRGNVATVIVKNGRMQVGNPVFTLEKEIGKARALFSPSGQSIKEILPGDAAEILGLSEIVPTGTILYTSLQEHVLPEVKPVQAVMPKMPTDLAAFFGEEKENTVSVILRTETSGELEAIKHALPSEIRIVFEGQGEISISDVLMAKDFKALLLGFHVGITREAERLAQNEKVFYKTYSIIYELIDEIDDLYQALQDQGKMHEMGRAEILASFDSTEGRVIGIKVNEGRFALGDTIVLVRREKEIGEAKLTSLKRGKQNVKEVGKGLECGLLTTPTLDFVVGDVILSYNFK